ncbi:MAG: hypothetical protein LBR72_02830 [Oscillospiraceae bacterium]|nr:hypothetical protein [Oscillospiraceae bacterium]
MKIQLDEKQSAALAKIGIPYSMETDYKGDALLELEDAITNYVVQNEINDSGTTVFGEELLLIHDHIVKEYDR